jgi:putative endonuclease
MTQSSYQTGQKGEEVAQAVLRQKGFSIEAANWRPPAEMRKPGEIDIIARHPEQHLLVFAEVKTRKSEQFGIPSEAVDIRKQQQLMALAEIYLSLHSHIPTFSIRFDVISVYSPGNGRPAEIEHLENAF